MDYITTKPGEDRHISLTGQLTFADNAKFREILNMVEQENLRSLVLDFSKLEFIDSAGLGMLLLLRDACQPRNISIAISSAKGQVEKIFLISKFDQLFSMAS